MATYFHGHGASNSNQEIQAADGLHTLYLMNPNYISAYNSASSDTSAQRHQQQQQQAAHHNMILMNSSALPHALNSTPIAHAPPSHQSQSQFLTLPFAQPISADDPARSGNNNFQYNLWATSNNNNGNNSNNQIDAVSAVTSGAMEVTMVASHHPYQIQVDHHNDVFRRPTVVSPNQQGLSLSLSGGGVGGNGLYHNRSGGGGGSSSSAAVPVDVLCPTTGGCGGDQESDNGVQNLIMGSKYLKAAQELLDEVVSVGKTSSKNTSNNKNDDQLVKLEKDKVMINTDGENEGVDHHHQAASAAAAANGGSSAAELSMTQRQELQMKKTKLISMLDEVEQRHRQYHHQMKIVVSSFEQVTGFGSAKSYTSLALKTISKQFRCLKDAITSQIKEASKSLGEEGDDCCLGVKGEGSRLRMIDHQIRNQRALQQLGMMQHNAWRPQRGLPERAVSVLRAWLFEHFLHPYPKDSDKHMLAKQTGLTRSQVSNWFINARVRLWKPMVEEMYLEEVKDHPEQHKGSIKDSNNAASTSKSNEPNNHQQDTKAASFQQPMMKNNQNASPTDNVSNSTISTSPNASSFQPPPPGFSLIGSSSSDMDGLFQYKSPKKPRGHETTQNSPSSILSMDMEMKAAGEINFSRQDSAKFGSPAVYGGQNGGGFGAYHQLGELSRFNPEQQLAQSFYGNSNNGNVSLTLGLPPGENLSPSYFSNQTMHGFDRRLEMGDNVSEAADGFCGINNNPGQASPQSNMGFQRIDIQNRKRYAAQLLPDFVA